ncbi:MAG TPA: Usg family protein [Stellaceae bacterium]|nr:Usg family protein [Stellaceae bacterium]
MIELSETPRLINGYQLTTAEILYHMPDFPDLLQSYVWQNLDMAPHFPVLRRFLDFWTKNLDGKLHSVIVDSLPVGQIGGWRNAKASLTLH